MIPDPMQKSIITTRHCTHQGKEHLLHWFIVSVFWMNHLGTVLGNHLATLEKICFRYMSCTRETEITMPSQTWCHVSPLLVTVKPDMWHMYFSPLKLTLSGTSDEHIPLIKVLCSFPRVWIFLLLSINTGQISCTLWPFWSCCLQLWSLMFSWLKPDKWAVKFTEIIHNTIWIWMISKCCCMR